MKDKPSKKRSAESQRLSNLAIAVAQSSSRIEDAAWQHQLDDLVQKDLAQKRQDWLDQATDALYQNHPAAYEVMIETLETVSTTVQLNHAGHPYQALLIAAPVLAWTRYEIAAQSLPGKSVDALTQALQDSILAADVRVALLPHLFALDQLPRDHSGVYALLKPFAQHLCADAAERWSAPLIPAVPFLADTRYLLAVIAAPLGNALFRWQQLDAPYDAQAAKEAALANWNERALPLLQAQLPGCGLEVLLPEAYYTACREADVRIRPASIRAAVFYLTHTLGVEPASLSVFIAGFCPPEAPEQISEYRIGFALSLPDQPEALVYGVVWPLYQPDDQARALDTDAHGALCGELIDALQTNGVHTILRHEENYPLEYCDDCGAPLFADREGELVHAEMPEDIAPPSNSQLH